MFPTSCVEVLFSSIVLKKKLCQHSNSKEHGDCGVGVWRELELPRGANIAQVTFQIYADYTSCSSTGTLKGLWSTLSISTHHVGLNRLNTNAKVTRARHAAPSPLINWPQNDTPSNDIVSRPRRVVAGQPPSREALPSGEFHHRLGAPARQVLLAVRGVVRVLWTRRVTERSKD